MVTGNPEPEDLRKFFRALKRAQRDIDLRPERYTHYYRREFPKRFHGQMDTRRWGPGERIVFEPYTKEVFEESFKWIAQRETVGKAGWNPALVGKPQTIQDLMFPNYVKEIFLDSDTKVACISGSYSVDPAYSFLTNDMKYEARIKDVGAKLAKGHNMSRRRFFQTAGGMAAAFTVMNQVHARNGAPLYHVEKNEARDLDVAQARADGLKNQFVMDMHTHFLREGTPIKAADNGTVAFEDSDMRGYGKIIILKHPDGFFTVYAHNRENLVKNGDSVEKGAKIGYVGSTGNASTAHLHFEVRDGKVVRNPLFFLP